MSLPTDSALQAVLKSDMPAIVADWHRRLQAVGGNFVLGLTPLPELSGEMTALLDGLHDALGRTDDRFGSDPAHPLAQALRAASRLRVARGYTSQESLQYLQAGKEAWMAALNRNGDAPPEAARRIERLMDRCVQVLVAEFVDAREAVILRQTESLREVSTPVITLWDSMLLLPLVGIVDSVRAQLISERLLEAISKAEAEVTLIDVTGVPVMDTGVARHILKTVAAAEMLGTRVILTGISPSTAQTMVKLGIDMTGVPTRATLKAGIALAMSLTRRRVVDIGEAPAQSVRRHPD